MTLMIVKDYEQEHVGKIMEELGNATLVPTKRKLCHLGK